MRFLLRRVVLLAFSFIVATLLFGLSAQANQSFAHVLSGKVSDSTGSSISDAIVDVIDTTTGNNVGTDTTDSGGNYDIEVNSGIYNIKVTPQAGSGFGTASAPNRAISVNTSINFIITLAGTATLSGHVLNQAGNPVPNQHVQLESAAGNVTTTTNSDGEYSLTVAPGVFRINISDSDNNNPPSLEVPRDYEIAKINYSLSENTVLDFTVPAKRVVTHVQDPLGIEVSGVAVRVQPPNGVSGAGFPIGGGLTASSSFARYDSPLITDGNGEATFWLLPNSGSLTYVFTAVPSGSSEYLSTNHTSVITDDVTEMINLLQSVTLSGHLYNQSGDPVPNQRVELESSAGNVPSITNEDGEYSLTVAPGVYRINISDSDNNNPPSLEVPRDYEIAKFNYSLTENTIVDFTIPAKKVIADVRNASGDFVSGVAMTAQPPSGISGADFPIGGGLTASSSFARYDNPGLVTNEDGKATFWLLPNSGSHTYTFVAVPPDGSEYLTTDHTDIFITDDVTARINLLQPVTLSGHVYNKAGDPVPNQRVELESSAGNVPSITNEDGEYSLTVAPGVYRINISDSDNNNPPSLEVPRDYEIAKFNYSLTENTVLDFTVPAKRVVTHVQDPLGSAVGGAAITVNPPLGISGSGFSIGGGLTASSSFSRYDSPLVTDENGNAMFWLLPNSGSLTYTFTATPIGSGIYSTLVLHNISVIESQTEEQTEFIQFQYNHDTPVTTALLETERADGDYSNPTTITLSASADEGYSIASIYYKVDSGAQQTYTEPFPILGAGEHTLEYWSVDSSGVQEAHKTKSFTIYTNEAPVVDPFSGGTINEGEVFTANSFFTDPDSNSWNATVDYGDGLGPEPLPLNADKTFQLSHQYATAGTYDVSVVVADDSQNTGTTIATVLVNKAPEITMPAEVTVNKDFAYNQDGSFADPDSWSWTASVDYGDGSGLQPFDISGSTFRLSHHYTVYGTYTITLTIQDNQGASTIGQTTVTVNQPTFTAENVDITTTNISFDITNIDPSYVDSHSSFFAIEIWTPSNATRYFSAGGATPNILSQQASCNVLLHCEVPIISDGNGVPSTYVIIISSDTLFSGTNGLTSQLLTWPSPITTTFTSVADTYIRSGQDHRNYGGGNFMRVQSSGDNRSLVRFDQTALQNQIGNKQILTAKLIVTIVDNGNNWGPTGRTIDAHRVITNWVEGNGLENNNRGTGLGATWACAIDSIIENQAKNCSGVTEWEMGPGVHPWVQSPTATQTITSNQTGVVEFDVTPDVANFLNGTNQNYGWIIKKTNEGQNGQVSFGTKESSYVPQLEVTYQP